MDPVLPCFGGNVPTAIKTHFPTANTIPYPPWNGFPNQSLLLDPTDPLFVTIGQTFVQEQLSVYSEAGVWPAAHRDHIFNCDVWMNDRQTFEPASTATSYLQAAGAAMVTQITNVVASGIWLNQGGWMFNYKWWQADGGVRVRDYLAHVPRNNTLIIELAAERGLTVDTVPTKNYWGHTWVWSLLHNYGQPVGDCGQTSAGVARAKLHVHGVWDFTRGD
eukprot:m.53083 g.53083  ORF g.53083 m.53083 type:complete len:219 (-) comp21707_c0_seq1:847-1503(-)